MQLNCKLLSCYCKQRWYFIGGCSLIQCENNNGDMSGGSKTGLIIEIVVPLLFLVLLILIVIIAIGIYFIKKRRNKRPELRKGDNDDETELTTK